VAEELDESLALAQTSGSASLEASQWVLRSAWRKGLWSQSPLLWLRLLGSVSVFELKLRLESH
jgi:hypothetical protein